MTNVFVKEYSKTLSEIFYFEMKYHSFETGTQLAKNLLKPLYYKQQRQMQLCKNEYDSISYYQMQHALILRYLKFKNFSDSDWKEYFSQVDRILNK